MKHRDFQDRELLIACQKENIYGWDGYRLTSNDVSLGVVPQIGGRVISLTHQGEELFFVQEEFKGEHYDLSGIDDLRAKKREFGFRLWGGDKTWVAPQQDWWEAIPPLDLDAGVYAVKIEDNGVEMQSPLCRETGLRIIRRVRLEDGIVHFQQTFRNETDSTIRRGIWNVTQVLRPFDVYLPAARENIRQYWDEGLTADASRKITEEGGFVKVSCDDTTHFKVGGFVDEGKIIALKRTHTGILAFNRYFDIDKKGCYAHDASVEIYNSPKHNYFEIEVHAPLVSLSKGEEITHSQIWDVKRFDDNISPQEILKYE